MGTGSYKELVVWQKSIDLVENVYQITKTLPKSETYALSSQIQRAAVSIPSNIAEVSARKNRKEYIQFLYIARASLAEVETQLVLVHKLYASETTAAETKLVEVRKMLSGLINKLKTDN